MKNQKIENEQEKLYNISVNELEQFKIVCPNIEYQNGYNTAIDDILDYLKGEYNGNKQNI